MSGNVVPFPSVAQIPDLEIGLATVQAGAAPILHKGVNDTFHGEVLLASGVIKLAYIKDLDPRELANELLVAALGQALGLPMPSVHLALVPNGVLPTNKAPKAADGAAFVLASEDAEAPSLKQFYNVADQTVFNAIVQRIVAWKDIDALYCVDTWCANIDRNVGNVLVDGTNFWMIDHGRCFSGPAWVADALDPAASYQNLITRWLTPNIPADQRLTVAKNAVDRVVLPDALLDAAVSLSQARRFLTPIEQTALTAFIKDRRAHLPAITAAALNVLVA